MLQDTSGPGAGVTMARPPHQADRGGGGPFPPQHLRVGGLLPRPRLPRRRLGVEAGDDMALLRLPRRSYLRAGGSARRMSAAGAPPLAEPRPAGLPPSPPLPSPRQPRPPPGAPTHLYGPTDPATLRAKASGVRALSRAFWPMARRDRNGSAQRRQKGGMRNREGKEEGDESSGPPRGELRPTRPATIEKEL